MNAEAKLKVIVLGPMSSGKTSISNFLSDATENIGGESRPTKGVRIVEFLAEGLKVKEHLPYRAEVELWDCSGDGKYDPCWPAILHKTDGIVFVYNQTSSKQDLENLYKYFVVDSGLAEKSCLVVLNQHGDGGLDKPSNPLPGLRHISVNLEENGAELRRAFTAFLSGIVNRAATDADS